MDDTISRQAAIDALRNRWLKTMNFDGIGEDIAEECEICLRTVPSVQPTVNTARHGHWIYRSFVDDWIGLLYICSECRDFCDSRYRFCPSCGAKMKGEGNADNSQI